MSQHAQCIAIPTEEYESALVEADDESTGEDPSSGDLRPSYILDRINAAEPFEQGDVANAFNGSQVSWVLSLRSTAPLFWQKMLMFQDHEKCIQGMHFGGIVIVTLPLWHGPRSRRIKPGDKFLVRGTIDRLDTSSIWLKDSSVEVWSAS